MKDPAARDNVRKFVAGFAAYIGERVAKAAPRPTRR